MHYFINGITKHYADFSGRARPQGSWRGSLTASSGQHLAKLLAY